jgi:hypothetical protein
MSQATVPIERLLPAMAPQATPRLHALPRLDAKARPRLIYATLAVTVVVAIIATQLLLSIGVSGSAYRLESLQATSQRLARDYQQVSENVDALASPQNLAANAQALGMVDDSTPVYLTLGTGQVIGAPTPASAAAGTAGQQLVANALTAGVPLVTEKKADAPRSNTQTPDPASTAGESAAAAQAPVPFTGALPVPSTH